MLERPTNIWSAHQLAEFVAGVTQQRDVATAVTAAMDSACHTFDAEFVAIRQGGELLGTLGFGRGVEGLDVLLEDVIAGRRTMVPVPGAGVCHTLVSAFSSDGTSGQLIVGRSAPVTYSSEEVHLLRSMGRVVGMALHTFRLLDSLRERQRLLERLSVIQRSIARRAGLNNVLSAVIAGVVELLDADSALIRLVDPENPDEHVLVASHGLPAGLVERIERIQADDSLTGRAVHDNTLVVSPPGQDPDRRPAELTCDASFMAAPIHDAGTPVGAIMVGCYRPNQPTFTDGEQEALALFAEHASIALTDARAVEALEQAMFDPLTRLPNRIFFRDRLTAARASRDGTCGPAVLFIDLDGFKAVNDHMGHGAGDGLLSDVALRLTLLVRPGDLVARHGGDEFTVLVQEVECAGGAARVASRILDGLRDPFLVGDREVQIGASIGVAFDDGDPDSDLVELADRAMYVAKQGGRGRYMIYGDVPVGADAPPY